MRKNINPLWVAILFASLSASFSFATTITWINTSGGDWNVAGNWSPSQVPSTNDTALITNSGTYGVTNSGTVSVNVLTLGGVTGTQTLVLSGGSFSLGSASTGNAQGALDISGGLLGGAGPLVLAGPMNWSGGEITNLVQFNGGSFSNSFILSSGQLINTGTLNCTASSIATGNGSIISNAATGIINLNANFNEGSVGGTRAFINAGQFNVAVPSAANVIAIFTNTGSVIINGGSLNLSSGGTSSGSIAVASGATLDFDGGATFSINSGTISGAGNFMVAGSTVNVGVGLNLGGTWTFSGGTANLNGTTTVSGNAVIISGGTVNFSGTGPWQPGTLALSLGTLEGGTPVTVQNPNGMSWSGGGILTNLVQFNGGTFSNSSVLNGGEVINTGTLNCTASSMATGNGSIISNAPAGIINVNANFSEGSVGAAHTFINAGQLDVAVPSAATFISSFTNSGSIMINGGALNLDGGGTSSGSITAASGTTLEFASGTFSINSGTLSGAGNLTVAAGTVNVGVGLNLGGTWTFSGGTANLNSTTTVSGNALIISGGTVNFSGTGPWQPGTLAISLGTLEGGTPVTVQNPNGMNWSGGGILTNLVQFNGGTFSSSMTLNGGEVINTGTLSWTATSIGTGNGSIISNAPSGIINLTANLSEGSVGGTRAIINAGQFNVAISGTAIIGDALTNTGTIALNGGTLELSGGGTSSGSITAVSGATLESVGGTFSINSGTLSGAGNLTVAAGTVNVGVGLNLGGTWTFIGGTVNLNGTTTVSGNAVVISGAGVNFSGTGPWQPGTLMFSSGTLEGGTPVTVENPNGLTWSGGGILTNRLQFNGGSFSNSMTLNGGEVINTGTLNWTATSIGTGSGSIISNAPSGIIDLTANLSEGFIGGARALINAGQLNVAISGTANIGDAFTNTGTITINSGILDLSGTHSFAGGTLNFGINALNNYGSNTLPAAAGLAGTLKSVFNGAYLPSVGNTYNIMTYGSSSGNFTATNLSPLAVWTVSQGATALSITVVKLVPQLSVPAEVVFGNSTIGSTLKATAAWNGTNVPGVFTYTPPAGTVLNIGLNQPLSVVFVPTDPSTFVSVTNNFLVSVIAPPSLAIELSGTQDILTFQAIPSESYQVESTTNLTVPMTPLGSVVSNANGIVNVTNNISAPQTFYRLLIQPGP